MKKLVFVIAIVGLIFSKSLFASYESNKEEKDENNINFLCYMIARTLKNDNRLYAVDGLVVDRNGKSIGLRFPDTSRLYSYTTLPHNIFFYTKSIDEFPEYKTMKNPRIYKIRRILARNLICESDRYVHFDSKSESKTKGFIIDVRDLYSIVGNDDELFAKTIVGGNRANLDVHKDVSPAAFRAMKSSSFVVEYDCECRIDDYYNYDFRDCEDTHWSVEFRAKYKVMDEHSSGEHFHGYIPKNTKVGEHLYSILKDGKIHNLNLTLRYPKTKESPGIVQILSVNNK